MAKDAREGRRGQEEREALKAEREAVHAAAPPAARPPAPCTAPRGAAFPAPGTHGQATVTPSPDPLVTTARGRNFAPKGTTRSAPINLGEVEPHQHPAPLGPGGSPPAEVQPHTAHPSSKLSFTRSQSPPEALSTPYWSSRDALPPHTPNLAMPCTLVKVPLAQSWPEQGHRLCTGDQAESPGQLGEKGPHNPASRVVAPGPARASRELGLQL